VAKLIGSDLPQHKIDGKDISGLVFGEKGARSPHEFFPHYHHGELQAIRNDRWKLVFPHSYRSLNGRPGGKGGLPVKYDSNMAELALYDRANDPSEEINVIDQYPEVYAELLKAAKIFRKELGDKLTKTKGTGIRSVGKLGPNDKKLIW
jgi:arylsulfatase A-like enzyme